MRRCLHGRNGNAVKKSALRPPYLADRLSGGCRSLVVLQFGGDTGKSIFDVGKTVVEAIYLLLTGRIKKVPKDGLDDILFLRNMNSPMPFFWKCRGSADLARQPPR